MFGKLDSTEIEQLISSQVIGRIGCHADDLTYIFPISYAYDGQYVYCLGQPGQKIDMLRKNPRLCFQVDDTTNLANWKSAIAWGTYEEISEPAARMAALRQLHDRHLPVITSATMHLSDQWPFGTDSPDDVKGIIFRFALEQKTGRFERAGVENFFAS